MSRRNVAPQIVLTVALRTSTMGERPVTTTASSTSAIRIVTFLVRVLPSSTVSRS
jgi:hypothetical protein